MRINKNLLSLKCVLFLFFGAIGSLFPFLPLHMVTLGLSKNEATLISILAPLIAVVGPLVAGPLADRLAGGFGGASRSKTGRYLRVMIAVCLAVATIFYWLLFTIPPIHRTPPNVTFICDEEGGFILQDRCGVEKTCYNWGTEMGAVQVKHCTFSCNATTLYKKVEEKQEKTTEKVPVTTDTSKSSDDDNAYDIFDGDNNDDGPNEGKMYDFGRSTESSSTINSRTTSSSNTNTDNGIYPIPHMCYNKTNGEGMCEVYTKDATTIDFSLGLKPSAINEDDEEGYCKYPFANPFRCRITEATRKELTATIEDCHPIIICEINDPYNNTNSLLKRSECGYGNISFWLYLLIRSIGDIFPAAAVALLSTAVVIATRETSTGRSDVGKQFAAGALGFAIFPPIIGWAANGALLAAMICFTVLMVIAILILLFDNKMPLSPPEWWWHTRCGLLALPMSSVRKYGFEIGALGVVLFLLGMFWNSIDTFLPWHFGNLKHPEEGTPGIIGLTITMAALPAVILFMFAEKIVDYCGHSNIFILCFVHAIVHHVAMVWIGDAAVFLVFEMLEITTLHLMWVTAVLYLRHLVPRKYTACGQALPVVAHFCLGRCVGAWIGSLAYTDDGHSFRDVHEGFAVAAAVIAAVYFILYQCYLKPKCGAQPQLPPYPTPSVVQGMNGNGSYTPLRVYHNGRAKKGHFRY